MAKRFEKAKEYTEQYKDMLLPCKVCGNTDIRIVSDRMIFEKKDGWSVCCMTPNCDCTGIYASVKAAIRKWNDKTPAAEGG